MFYLRSAFVLLCYKWGKLRHSEVSNLLGVAWLVSEEACMGTWGSPAVAVTLPAQGLGGGLGAGMRGSRMSQPPQCLRRAQSSCCHFMVKLLDDGTFIIPGEKVAHTSLDALVTFHQQNPIEPRRELLTQPCRQKDPANVDYEDLFLYSNAVAEAAACPVSAPEEASPKPVLRHQSKERKPSSEMNRVTTEEATSSCPPKTPLGETRQKLWRSLKMLPQRGQRVRQQLKSHLVTVSLPSLLDVRRSTVISGPGTGKGSEDHSGDPTSGDRVHTDPCVVTSLKSPSQPQAPKDRKIPTRKAERSASYNEVTPGDRSWHQMVMRALSSQESTPEHQGLAEPENDQLPEEYQQPPPFAPGYC
ncbi:hematopoietic SH2 domain-containing protein isoform X3 [Macaca fascicularis]|uniref:hematopoietic SH2 domain-containing protein isoform X3 n=2 Tax=Macaca fascicularis TaxID=9541 RepID=UPI0032B07E0B